MEERDDKYVEQQEQAAAAEAARIGGQGGEPDDVDPAERAVREGGGGEEEGFEEAERQLIENAENAEGGPSGEFDSEPEQLDSRGEYGEPSHEDSTEVTSDPDAPRDDPGEGPGLTTER